MVTMSMIGMMIMMMWNIDVSIKPGFNKPGRLCVVQIGQETVFIILSYRDYIAQCGIELCLATQKAILNGFKDHTCNDPAKLLPDMDWASSYF